MEHNYQKKLVELIAVGVIKPGFSEVEVIHDDWCGIHKMQRCDCDPDFQIVTRDPEEPPPPTQAGGAA